MIVTTAHEGKDSERRWGVAVGRLGVGVGAGVGTILGVNTCHGRCGRCHKNFRHVSAGVRQFSRGTWKHTHTQIKPTDLHVGENQAMHCKIKEVYLGLMDYGPHMEKYSPDQCRPFRSQKLLCIAKIPLISTEAAQSRA